MSASATGAPSPPPLSAPEEKESEKVKGFAIATPKVEEENDEKDKPVSSPESSPPTPLSIAGVNAEEKGDASAAVQVKVEIGGEEGEGEAKDGSQYLTGMKLWLVMLGLSLSALLVGLDNAILATAIPTITTVFNSLEDVGWYGSAFLITVCANQPIAGKLFTYFDLRWTYLLFLLFFELGSLFCATAVNSVMLIIGRAVAGCGAAGLLSGGLAIIGNHIVLRQRPIWTGLLVSMYGISNVVGPILGAAFTEDISWRWCFYINLPIGAITALVLLLFFTNVPPRPLTTLPISEKFSHLDLPGLILFMPAVVMVLLVLQWGGHGHAWNSPTIIGLLIGFLVLSILFCIWQWRQQEEASIPPRIVLQRSVWTGAAILFFGLGNLSLVVYYLPMWFQVVLRDGPIESGIRFLPCLVANFIMSIVSGAMVTQFGYYNPWLFFGSVLATVSSGLMSAWEVDVGHSMIIGIQILVGMGVPLLLQMPLIGLMAIIPEVEMPIAMSTVVFFQFLGGSIFLGVAENLFVSGLKEGLAKYAPNIDAAAVVAAGAVGLHKVVTNEADLPSVVLAYNDAIMGVFYLGIAGGILAFVFSFGMEWASVKGKQVTSAV